MWLLHELAHVEARHRLLVVEEELGERLGELGLAHAARPEKEEAADRACPGSLQAHTPTTDGLRDERLHGLFLANDALR
jgi:hypothetical protein